MKQPIAVLLAGILLIAGLSLWASAESGDVNRDGSVDMKDVLTLRKHIANIGSCDDEAAADMNEDSSLDMKDVLLLRLFIVNGTVSEDATSSEESSEPDADAVIDRVIELVNQHRAEAGVAPLKRHDRLQQAAQVRVAELKELFSHTRPDGTSCFTVFSEFGIAYSRAAENIACGQKTPEDVVAAWMASEGHRKNILASDVTYIAVGFDPETYSWVQLFLKPQA